MKKLQLLIFLQSVIVVAMLLGGCGSSISFTADTVIGEEGNVVRTVQFASSGSASFDDLQQQYDLPPGGVWTESEVIRQPGAPNTEPMRVYNREYALTRRFGPGADIAGDYRRRAYNSDRAAYNEISVRARHLWFVDLYDYEETFSDIPTVQSMAAAVRAAYDMIAGTYAEELAALGIAGLTQQDARDRLDARFGPLVEVLITALTTKCVSPAAPALEECFDEIEQVPDVAVLVQSLDDTEMLLGEFANLFPAPDGVAADDWLATLELDVLNEVENRLSDYAEDEWLETYGTDFFGAHNLTIFDSYPFDLTVRMPGDLVATNADTQDSGLLSWEFDHEDFILNDLMLAASSRVVHRTRIVAAAAIVPLLPIVWMGWIRSRAHRAGEV